MTTVNDTTPDAANEDIPYVSVVIPCFNEEATIGIVLENLMSQYYRDRYEIIVVDGLSTDRTRQLIESFAQNHPDVAVRLINNPKRHIPIALNLAIDAARGEIIIRMDAHSIPSAEYVRTCVEDLLDGSVAVAGVPWRITPGGSTRTARAIALAASHFFGVGNAPYRLARTGPALYVDTVPFGAFRKVTWQQVGGFNETLLTNEDYEFNYKVRTRSGKILLDRRSYCNYIARATITDLARQYYRYGTWKFQMLKQHPRSCRWRQLVPPFFMVSLAVLTLLSMWSLSARLVFTALISVYVLLATLFAVRVAIQEDDLLLSLQITSAFIVMHFGWGLGFLRGTLRFPTPAVPGHLYGGAEEIENS